MEKKPLTMKQKYRIFNIGRIISYALLILGFLMNGFRRSSAATHGIRNTCRSMAAASTAEQSFKEAARRKCSGNFLLFCIALLPYNIFLCHVLSKMSQSFAVHKKKAKNFAS